MWTPNCFSISLKFDVIWQTVEPGGWMFLLQKAHLPGSCSVAYKHRFIAIWWMACVYQENMSDWDVPW